MSPILKIQNGESKMAAKISVFRWFALPIWNFKNNDHGFRIGDLKNIIVCRWLATRSEKNKKKLDLHFENRFEVLISDSEFESATQKPPDTSLIWWQSAKFGLHPGCHFDFTKSDTGLEISQPKIFNEQCCAPLTVGNVPPLTNLFIVHLISNS